jgi:hypothetical protein
MTEFSTEAELSFSDSSVKSASRQLERELSDISITQEVDSSTTAGVGGQSGSGVATTATTAIGTKLSGVSGALEDTVGLDKERNTLLSGLLEATERGEANGGGGGGGVSSLLGLGSVASMMAGTSLTSLITPVSLGSLVTKVSAGVLVKSGLAVSTLITGGLIAKNLIEGKATLSDIINPLNSLGDLIAGPVPLPELIETGVGLGAFIAGGASIASFVTGTSISSLVAGSSIAALVAGAPLAAIVGGVALTALVGTVAIDALVDGKIDIADRIVGHVDRPDKGEDSVSDVAHGNPDRQYPDVYGDTDRPSSTNLDGYSTTPGLDSNDIDEAYANTAPEVDIPTGPPEDDSWTKESDPDWMKDDNNQPGSSGGTNNSTKMNQARDRTGGDTKVEHKPTYNVDLSSLERKLDGDLRDLKRRIEKLERGLQR